MNENLKRPAHGGYPESANTTPADRALFAAALASHPEGGVDGLQTRQQMLEGLDLPKRPAAATPLQQSGLGEGRRSSSDVERDYEALVYRRCETIGLDDLEGGCCPTCRARGRLATPVPVDAGGGLRKLAQAVADSALQANSDAWIVEGAPMEALLAALASPPVAGDREAQMNALWHGQQDYLRLRGMGGSLGDLPKSRTDLRAAYGLMVDRLATLTDPQAAAKEPSDG